MVGDVIEMEYESEDEQIDCSKTKDLAKDQCHDFRHSFYKTFMLKNELLFNNSIANSTQKNRWQKLELSEKFCMTQPRKLEIIEDFMDASSVFKKSFINSFED